MSATALFCLYPHMGAVAIVGTDIAHAVPLALVAGTGHLQLGTVDATLPGSLLLGSLPGIMLGSLLAPHIPERILRSGLASVQFVIGGKLVP